MDFSGTLNSSKAIVYDFSLFFPHLAWDLAVRQVSATGCGPAAPTASKGGDLDGGEKQQARFPKGASS